MLRDIRHLGELLFFVAIDSAVFFPFFSFLASRILFAAQNAIL